MARHARETEDDDARAFNAHHAPITRKRWRCPFGGHEMPTKATDLDEDCQSVIAEVEALTGAEGMCTCPVFYASLPWAHRAAMARLWRDKGQLELYEPQPSNALIEAIDVIENSARARERREWDQFRREQEARQQKPPNT